MIRVKVCGITRVNDAATAAEAGADVLGFVMEPSSPRFVSDSSLLALCHGVAPYLPFCAVFGWFKPGHHPSTTLVQSYDEPAGDARWVKVVPVRPDSTLKELIGETVGRPIVLLDKASAQHGGTGEPIDWGLAAELVAAVPLVKVVLAGGLGPDNVAGAVRKVRPYAVDASSRLESSPGIKDADKVRAFVEAAKAAW